MKEMVAQLGRGPYHILTLNHHSNVVSEVKCIQSADNFSDHVPLSFCVYQDLDFHLVSAPRSPAHFREKVNWPKVTRKLTGLKLQLMMLKIIVKPYSITFLVFHLIYWTVLLLTALHIMNKLITIAINFCIVFRPQLIYAYHVLKTSTPRLFLGGINMFVAAEHLQFFGMVYG